MVRRRVARLRTAPGSPDRLLEGLVVAVGEVSQLCHGHIVLEDVNGQRHRGRNQLVG
jgi:hypothetical protein